MNQTVPNLEITAMSFEEALMELEKLVRQLEEGKTRLDDSITAYERGMALKRHCETKLREAQAKIDRIAIASDGTVTTQPANIE